MTSPYLKFQDMTLSHHFKNDKNWCVQALPFTSQWYDACMPKSLLVLLATSLVLLQIEAGSLQSHSRRVHD